MTEAETRGAEIARTEPIVFLHIPKTAGQTIHHALAGLVGASHVSPIRTHTQAGPGESQMPPGYALYSGHIDWTELETLPAGRFTFTVLRDPRERIASFYFFLLKEARALSAEALSQPQHAGKKRILERSAADYFFSDDTAFNAFIRDHYDNFYCSYLATRKMRGRRELVGMDARARVAAALENRRLIDRIYSVRRLDRFELDIAERYGAQVSVTGTFVNAGDMERGERRWPKLIERLGSDVAARRLGRFVTEDLALVEALGVEV